MTPAGVVRMLADRAATVLLARVERRLLEVEAVAAVAYEVALDARALAREHDVTGGHA